MNAALRAILLEETPPGMVRSTIDGVVRFMTPLALKVMRNQALRHTADLTGRRFGLLTVVTIVGETGGKLYWECRCDCGNRAFVLGPRLSAETGTRSCGCLRKKNCAQVGSGRLGKKFATIRTVRTKGARSRKAAA